MATSNPMVPTPTNHGMSHEEALYRGIALAQLRILKQQMQLGGLTIGSRRVKLDDGTEIFCNICFNAESVQVVLPKYDNPADMQPKPPTVGLFLCQPRYCTSLSDGWDMVNEFYSISYKYCDFYGYDLNRREVSAWGDAVYPLSDGDRCTSLLNSSGKLLPVENEYYGNVDWQDGNGNVITWFGAHSRYGIPYDAGVGLLYQAKRSQQSYSNGKKHKELPTRFVLPDDYGNGQLTGIASLPLVFNEVTFEYPPLFCSGACFVSNGSDKWLINVANTNAYAGNYVLALHISKGSGDDWIHIDDSGNPAWMLAGYLPKLVNVSWFFNQSGNHAVATESWIINHLYISFENGMPLAVFSEENTHTVANSHSYTTASKDATETSSGVLAADFKGDTLVKAIATQTFTASEKTTYDQTVDADYTGEDRHYTLTTRQSTPSTDYTCSTVLDACGLTTTLQAITYYYRLDYNADYAWVYEGFNAETQSTIYNHNYYSEQGVASFYDRTLGAVLYMDLRHDVLCYAKRSIVTGRSFSGTIATGSWVTEGLPYQPPGVIDVNYSGVYGGDVVDSGHTTSIYHAGKLVDTIHGGEFLGMITFSALLTNQADYFQPSMPQPDYILTGEINAYISNHPIGAFACNGDDFFYSFLINDKVVNGTSVKGDMVAVDAQVYDFDNEGNKRGENAEYKLYFPIAPSSRV